MPGPMSPMVFRAYRNADPPAMCQRSETAVSATGWGGEFSSPGNPMPVLLTHAAGMFSDAAGSYQRHIGVSIIGGCRNTEAVLDAGVGVSTHTLKRPWDL